MITYRKFVLSEYSDCLIVTDGNIARLYGIKGDNVYILPQGEKAKCFAEAEKLCKWFLLKKLPRSGTVVAVGGGSIGDAAGFAASIYKRGTSLIHVPTTLVAQIDSSIGGKTAVDLDGVKNAVGTFYNADTVIDFDFLRTLNAEQLNDGYGELIKYRMLSEEISAIPVDNTEAVIKACVSYKEEICKRDPYDSNERRLLNFGHTIGHAMELCLGISHGKAVANGLYYETLLAFKAGKCPQDYCRKWRSEISEKFRIYPLTEEILNYTVNDKKNAFGKVAFILPHEFAFTEMPLDVVKSLLL
ncbi:MAG: 3-dehydroquinate synthase [Corallococcus sp.]|nr:3-dehydroquinate synthase [Bacillota bacterium]MCM1533144.1 3-dehydroquinate synthase [Corallococcus sp.]